jgi:hypothetical protein
MPSIKICIFLNNNALLSESLGSYLTLRPINPSVLYNITSRAFKLDRNSLYEYIPDGDSHKDFDKWSHQSREHLSGLQGDILRKGYLNLIETCQMQFKRRTYSKTGPYI